jgi:hypothetical protein
LVGFDDKWTWGVVGVGRAGRARAEAIHNDSRCELVAVSRGRFAAEFDVPEVPFVDLLDQVDAVAICSPTAVHVEQIREALDAGCQTVVEFPIARRAGDANELFEFARSEGLMLHVEHIELLLGWHQRLHNISDLSPIISVDKAHWSPGCLELALNLENGDAALTIRSGPDLSRQTEVDVQDQSAMWTVRGRRLYRAGKAVPVPASKRSLFDQDHQHVMARLGEELEPYVTERRTLEVLEHIETIRTLLEEAS